MQPTEKKSADQPLPSWWQRHRQSMLRTLGMLLATSVLLLCADMITPAPCWAVFALLSLVAFPIWQYRTEYLLFRRRLVLAGAARPASWLRALLWRGAVTKGVQAVVSMFLAWVLLALVAALTPLHGYVLVADAIFLSLLAGPVTRQLQGDIKDRHTGVIARRWPLFLINGIVLSVAMVMLDFFVTGSADTRHMEWQKLAGQEFMTLRDAAGCLLWGVSAGALAVLEALSWHFSELLIPNLPDVASRLGAWLFFLLRAVALAWLYTALLLGISVFLDKREARRAGRPAQSLASRSFIITIILLALPFFYASVKLNAFDPGIFRAGEHASDPCRADDAGREQLVMKLDMALANERDQAIESVDSSIDRGLENIFTDIEAGVDDYLDWYFTVTGEYQRLAAVFTGDVATAMSEKLEEHLFAQSDFGERLESLDGRLENLSSGWFAQLAPSLGSELENAPCAIGRVDLAPLMQLDRDNLRASSALASGVGAGIVTSKVLAKKTAAAVVGKVAAKKSFYTGAAVITKILAKKGSSTALSAGLGATLCAPAGPVAILCGVAAGLVTWLAVDKALIEFDETYNREEMRTDILETLDEQREILRMQLREKHYLQIDRLAARMNNALQRTFIPYNDGMGIRGSSDD